MYPTEGARGFAMCVGERGRNERSEKDRKKKEGPPPSGVLPNAADWNHKRLLSVSPLLRSIG